MTSTALRTDPADLIETDASAARTYDAGADTETWGQLWFTLERHGWGSLALVPASPGTSSRALGERLADAARAYYATPVDIVDAEHVAAEEVQTVIASVSARALAGARVLIALPSPLVRASAIPLARTADAALLVVPLGESSVGDARRTVAAMGGPHFLGSVTVRPR